MADEEWVTGNIRIKVKGRPFEMQMTVPAKPVKPHRMLPIFQKMTNAFVDASVGTVEAQGKAISCKAGCGACCSQAVPISEMEVYQIAELVESMPEPRRSEIKRRFAQGAAHFHKIGWFDKMNAQYDSGPVKSTEAEALEAIKVVQQYFREGIPCPFLENQSCSIHESRPIACREYLVTSPAVNCSNPTAETIRMISLIVKPSKTLRDVGSTGRLSHIRPLTLIRALELAEEFPESFQERTGPEWVAEF